MDPRDSEIGTIKPRRSTRRKALDVVLEPREPIQTRKRGSRTQITVRSVSGSKDHSEYDDEPPNTKKKKREPDGEFDGGDDADEMDFEETKDDFENKLERDMMAGGDNRHPSIPSSLDTPYSGDMSLPVTLPSKVQIDSPDSPDLHVPRSRRSIHINDSTGRNKGRVETSRKSPVATYATQLPLKNSSEVMRSNMQQYREKMEAPAKSTGYSRADYYDVQRYPKYDGISNNTSKRRTSQNQGTKKSKVIEKTPESPSVGPMWFCFLLKLVFAALVVAVLSALAYQYFPRLHWPEGGGVLPSRSVMAEEFVAHLSALKTQFPNQRPEFWRRSRIHLERHLQTAQPTEPVSLLLTAGRRAEKTLACLAKRLASSFSSALNASVLHINGASKSTQVSDQVKLDIDNQLRAAFEGDKPVAVIHRFEELPPGSTLIFYRYCDHENAAYKKVFFAFTVLLPHDDVDAHQSLKDVEEMVQDHVHDKFLGSIGQISFNQMDADKLSGLWSRISHLILPVAAESDIEQNGC